VDVIALPHPSGLSTWHRTEPGKTLLTRALRLIKEHPAWCRAFAARLECKPNE
ncbi:MAG TPA: uracil-DNA glycosylase, partial [Gammaproteobacteria bacterium]|nr:uracil-DNA glycosylase [Gammaproteobacteria bacterium]